MGLVEQQAAAARAARSAPIAPGRELAVLVAVEFTGERRRLTASARLARADAARTAAARTAERAHPSPPAGQPDEAQDVQPDKAQPPPDLDFDASLAEFQELARSAGAEIADTLVQRRARPDPATLVGQGKLAEIEAVAASTRANVVLFDHDLSPSQLRNLEATLPCRVIDRTQLILDIFAQRAESRDGKLQVELAQLKYSLPRLGQKDDSLSRLTGGIGGRGPGETKLEIGRRRAKERVTHLQAQLKQLAKQRQQRRRKRTRGRVPTVAIVGYTNAGKSTLLNTLTGADVLAEDRLFATLDTRSRRLRVGWAGYGGREVILTDTVGFIRDLPKDLFAAFRATFEEAADADLLLQVVDASDPARELHLRTTEELLVELDIDRIPRIVVYNKSDLIEPAEGRLLLRGKLDTVLLDARSRETTLGLIELIAAKLAARWEEAASVPETLMEATAPFEETASDALLLENETTTLDGMREAAGKRRKKPTLLS
jgi:GTP-binding protein HflX